MGLIVGSFDKDLLELGCEGCDEVWNFHGRNVPVVGIRWVCGAAEEPQSRIHLRGGRYKSMPQECEHATPASFSIHLMHKTPHVYRRLWCH